MEGSGWEGQNSALRVVEPYEEGAGHRRQYDACALHAGYLSLQINTHTHTHTHTHRLCNNHCLSTATLEVRCS